jgi:hypothetical protein
MKFLSEITALEKQIGVLAKKMDSYKSQQQKVVVGIISCMKNADKIETIRQTWAQSLKKVGIPYFFVIGDSQLEKPLVKGDLLYVPTNDYYENLPEKVSLFYEYIHDNTDFDFLFKIDDDCYLNVEKTFKSDYWKHDYYGKIIGLDPKGLLPDWHFGKCDDPALNGTPYWKPYVGPWCGGGYGYFLSRKAMKIVRDNMTEISDDLYEDKAIGDVLRMNGILPNGSEAYLPLNPFEYIANVNDTEQFKSMIEYVIGRKLFDHSLVMEIRNEAIMLFMHSIFLDPVAFNDGPKNNLLLSDKGLGSNTDKVMNLITESKELQKIIKEKDQMIGELEKKHLHLLEEKQKQISLLEEKVSDFKKERESQINMLRENFLRSTKESEAQINTLLEEIKNQKQSLDWYKETYENRKIIGIVKDKLLKSKKNNK